MAAQRFSARKAAGGPNLDWSNLEFEAKSKETPEQEKHRLQMERWNTVVDIARRVVLYIATAALVIIMCYLCFDIVRDIAASPDDRKWATAILTSITTALVAFLVGQRVPEAK